MTSGGQIHDPLPVAAALREAPPQGGLSEMVREVIGAKALFRQFVLRDLKVKYKQAALGVAWAVFMPALIVASGVLVRYAMSQVAETTFDVSTVGALMLKGLAWGFFVAAIGVATSSLTGHGNLITKVYFPREVLPLSAIFAVGIDTAVGVILFLVTSPFLGLDITVHALWAPVLVALFVCLTVGLGMLLSCANVFFRDVKYIVQMLLMFGIFFTPVFFEPQMLGASGARVVMLNPLAPLLEGLRLAVVHGHNLLEPLSVPIASGVAVVWEPWYLFYSAAWAVGGLLVSATIFHRAAAAFPEYV